MLGLACCGRSRKDKKEVPGDLVPVLPRKEAGDLASVDAISGPDTTNSSASFANADKRIVTEKKGSNGLPSTDGAPDEGKPAGNFWLNMQSRLRLSPAGDKAPVQNGPSASVLSEGQTAQNGVGGAAWLSNPLANLSALAPKVGFLDSNAAAQPDKTVTVSESIDNSKAEPASGRAGGGMGSRDGGGSARRESRELPHPNRSSINRNSPTVGSKGNHLSAPDLLSQGSGAKKNKSRIGDKELKDLTAKIGELVRRKAIPPSLEVGLYDKIAKQDPHLFMAWTVFQA